MPRITKAQLVAQNEQLSQRVAQLEAELAEAKRLMDIIDREYASLEGELKAAKAQRPVARQIEVTGSYVKAGQVFEKRRAWEFGRLVTTHVCVGMAQ